MAELLPTTPARETRYRLAIFIACRAGHAFHRDSDTLSITRLKLPLSILPPTCTAQEKERIFPRRIGYSTGHKYCSHCIIIYRLFAYSVPTFFPDFG
jgi:hypothetical protein